MTNMYYFYEDNEKDEYLARKLVDALMQEEGVVNRTIKLKWEMVENIKELMEENEELRRLTTQNQNYDEVFKQEFENIHKNLIEEKRETQINGYIENILPTLKGRLKNQDISSQKIKSYIERGYRVDDGVEEKINLYKQNSLKEDQCD